MPGEGPFPPLDHKAVLQSLKALEAFNVIEVWAVISPFRDPRAVSRNRPLTTRSATIHFEHAIETRPGSRQAVERDNHIQVIESRLSLVSLIQIEPAAP